RWRNCSPACRVRACTRCVSTRSSVGPATPGTAEPALCVDSTAVMADDALPLIPPARPVFGADDRARVTAAVDKALATGALTLGPCTREFEQLVADRLGLPHAVAVSSGTAALEIVLRSLDVRDRAVIVPANTFYATAGAVAHAGGRVHFADVDPRTFALSRDTV